MLPEIACLNFCGNATNDSSLAVLVFGIFSDKCASSSCARNSHARKPAILSLKEFGFGHGCVDHRASV